MKKLSLINLRLIFIMLAVVALSTYSCKDDELDTAENVASCEGCHTNYLHLKEVYTPDTELPAGGCGGEAPHYEPYDRVYMGGEGFEEYKKTSHYKMGCVECHNGTDNTDDKTVAHSGDFVAHPSEIYEQKCSSCHEDVAKNFATSIHNGTGQMRKVAMRSGLNGADEFDLLPAHQIEGYTKNCATCHGTCGNCHVVRPSAGGGGLAKGHLFAKTPDMLNVCITCHTSRGGHAYLGVASGTVPDVHLTGSAFTCLTCHTGSEIHGDGNKVEQRYAYDKLPVCSNCHTTIQNSNTYHEMHYEDFNCQVCHSQDYNNCGSCHVHGEGARIASYQGFKIALNPIPDIKKDYKFALVRRTLAAPDNWVEYDVPEYADFDVFPTYNFTTPHNIIRWTSRTQVAEGEACFIKCHIYDNGTELVNKELYLFYDDLLDWEQTATGPYTVDNALPAGWESIGKK